MVFGGKYENCEGKIRKTVKEKGRNRKDGRKMESKGVKDMQKVLKIKLKRKCGVRGENIISGRENIVFQIKTRPCSFTFC
jgi:hypothetical protein